ncbi:unnamed protein product [Phytophthora fragariaefolia]|uniref:Unnamed protein product n=1 Tax=Phytophthora fragariaefolia TaxID=1490495 RepID=A0A9W6XTV5_9STRA|nr:unnamed protein product [Phytophthora fragariaefolia]
MGNIFSCHKSNASKLDTCKTPTNDGDNQAPTVKTNYKAHAEKVDQPAGCDGAPKEQVFDREKKASTSTATAKPFLTVCTPLLSSEGVVRGGAGNYGDRR